MSKKKRFRGLLDTHQSEFEEAVSSYVEAALWSSTDGDEPLDRNYSVSDFSKDFLLKADKDVEKFLSENFALIKKSIDDGKGDWGQAGHDFWLTRNGHGAGFWDGDWSKEVEKQLTSAAKKFGEIDLYVGDDKKIHS